MSLCRHYVRGLRRSVLAETPDFEKSGSKRSSQVLDQYGDIPDPDMSGPSAVFAHEKSLANPDHRVSAFLRTQTNGSGHSPSNSHDSSEPMPRASFMTSSHSNSPHAAIHDDDRDDDDSPASTNVSRQDIRASAEKILYTYLLQGSEREIIIPMGILNEITTAIESEGRDDPEVFDAAKDYVFQAMERDAFPGFLRAKALGNIVQPSMLLRLIVGLVSIFGAFWTAFCLIFLNYSRETRCWVRIDFFFPPPFLLIFSYFSSSSLSKHLLLLLFFYIKPAFRYTRHLC